jgi:hypothetical protein
VKQRRYRRRLRDGIACVTIPITRPILDHLVREKLLPRDREVATRDEIAAAAGAALDRLARSER